MCKPDSPPKLYERVAFGHANDGIAAWESRPWPGRVTDVSMDRARQDVLLLDGKEALAVHGCDITVVHATPGDQLSHHSVIPHHRVPAENVAAVAQAGRGRWKIAKEHNHGLETKGYHVEHHLGPGQPSLAAVMLRLNLRALLFQTVLEWREAKYGLLRQVLARRQTFFHDIQAFRRDLVLDSWDHLMDVMIRGLELESPCDTSGSPKLELLGGRGGRWKRPRALPILILLLGAG